MKLAGRLAWGYLLLVALLAGATAWQVALAFRLHDANRRLARTGSELVGESLALGRQLDLMREFTLKHAVLDEPAYLERLAESRERFAAGLSRLRALSLEPTERQALGAIESRWRLYLAEPETAGGGDRSAGAFAASRQIESVASRVDDLFEVARAGMASELAASTAAANRARSISWLAAVVAVVVAAAAGWVVIRSVTVPIGRLAGATRRLADGRFPRPVAVTGSQELVGLARDFNRMAERLKELDELKKQFVSQVSHELKAPLASMQETNRTLLEGLAGPLDERQRRLLELNQASAARLAGMIEEMLDLSRLEAGAVDYEMAPADLAALVRQAIDELRGLAGRRDQQLEAHLPAEPVTVICDPRYLEQVVRNLLANAIKYSPPSGEVTVRLQPASETRPPAGWQPDGFDPAGACCLLEIRDSGPGIPDEEKPRIFERFHRGRRHDVSEGGWGLGLAIARQVVEAHGGALWVEDDPRGGSLFRLLLELDRGARGASR